MCQDKRPEIHPEWRIGINCPVEPPTPYTQHPLSAMRSTVDQKMPNIPSKPISYTNPINPPPEQTLQAQNGPDYLHRNLPPPQQQELSKCKMSMMHPEKNSHGDWLGTVQSQSSQPEMGPRQSISNNPNGHLQPRSYPQPQIQADPSHDQVSECAWLLIIYTDGEMLGEPRASLKEGESYNLWESVIIRQWVSLSDLVLHPWYWCSLRTIVRGSQWKLTLKEVCL